MDGNELPLAARRDFVKYVLDRGNDIFGPWICSRLGVPWHPGYAHTIGLMDTQKGPVAGALFEGCNGASIRVHLAIEGKSSVNREFLWFVSYYPFEQLRVNKVIALVEASNDDSVRWTEHFGFTREATLRDAAPKGDLLIYSMTRDQCRWLALGDKYRGKAQSTSAA